jgi:hypothetical protein
VFSLDPKTLADALDTDEAEVRKTHFKYGYYLDKCLYDEVR